MFKRIALLMFAALASLTIPALSQTTVTLSASNVADIGGNKLSAGTITITPVDSNDRPLPGFSLAGGGAGLNSPLVVPIVNGAFSVQVANTASTSPANICMDLKVHNAKGQVVLSYPCVQPMATTVDATTGFWVNIAGLKSNGNWCQGSVCSLDLYQPTSTPTAILQAGIQGPQGLAGPTGATGAAATVAVGQTTTAAPGTPASVTNTGSSAAAVLSFVIPQGATGAAGPQGPAGSNASVTPAAVAAVGALSNDTTGNAATSTTAATANALPSTITGLVNTVAGVPSAAVPGTDYVMPSGTVAHATMAVAVSGPVAGAQIAGDIAGNSASVNGMVPAAQIAGTVANATNAASVGAGSGIPFLTGGTPAPATAAQVVSLIASTPVANATNATTAAIANSVPASGLTGATLANTVLGSSLTSLGNLTFLNAAVLNAQSFYVQTAPSSCSYVISGTTYPGSTQMMCAHLAAKQYILANNLDANVILPAGLIPVEGEIDIPCALSTAWGMPSENFIGAGGSHASPAARGYV